MRTWQRVLLALSLLGVATVAVCAALFGGCWSAWLAAGLSVGVCPDGKVLPVATLAARDLGRGARGPIEVGVDGHYWDPRAESVATSPIRRFTVDLSLVSPSGTIIELPPADKERWRWSGARRLTRVQLPDVPDGDWTLRAVAHTPVGDATVTAPVPLYRAARGHILTDAPLYKPGGTIRFRALLLAATDLAPVEGRPGRWRVRDPDGELLLEERGVTGAYGVVSGDFPLAEDAAAGTWTIEFVSGDLVVSTPVAVRPFVLPRVTVTAAADRPAWYVGERPVIVGKARFGSGAAVADAPVRVTARSDGPWPAPLSWTDETLLRTDRDGNFSLVLSEVPDDVRGVADVQLRFEVTDPGTQESAVGTTSVRVSEDRVVAEAVTEDGDRLAPRANNRMFVRVTTPEGTPLSEATLRVRRTFDAADPWIVATTDADGVARVQVDPGEPVSVEWPPMPVRIASRAATAGSVSLNSVFDRITGAPLDVVGRATAAQWAPRVGTCAALVPPDTQTDVQVTVRIDREGRAATAVGEASTPLDACAAAALLGARGPTGLDRAWVLDLRVQGPDTPALVAERRWSRGSSGADAIEAGLHRARGCVASTPPNAPPPDGALWWTVPARQARAQVIWVGADDTVGRCVARALDGAAVAPTPDADEHGAVALRVTQPAAATVTAPQATVLPGFAYTVEVLRGDTSVGTTTLRLQAGETPPLRLRASDVVVSPGDAVTFTALRGPNFSGTFPFRASLTQGAAELAVFDFDQTKREGTVTIPEGARGFASVEILGARQTIWIRPKSTLSLDLTAVAPEWRPGAQATLTITAREGLAPTAAGVTLTGVDATMAALAPLPEPDALGDLGVAHVLSSRAFDVFDARALHLGLVRGADAARAVVLRITSIDAAPHTEALTLDARGPFEADSALADAYWRVHAAVSARVRAWEVQAPEGETLTVVRAFVFWEDAVRDTGAVDAFGRPLRLTSLPRDLIELIDPRELVADGRRLPEDQEDWMTYVGRSAR